MPLFWKPYTSDVTSFIDELKKRRPTLEDEQRQAQERQAERHAPTQPPHSPAEAAARILELRKGNILPAGATIKDLINHGRA